jgi:Uma2 family endonuclease
LRDLDRLVGRYEALIRTSGPHNYPAGKLSRCMGTWLDENEFGVAIQDTEFAIGDSRLQPDLAVLLWCQWERIGSGVAPLTEVPLIAAEIVSPSESALRPDEKTAVYLEGGVREVWALCSSTEHLFIHRADGSRRLDRDGTIETSLIPGWSMPMSQLLRKKGRQYF